MTPMNELAGVMWDAAMAYGRTSMDDDELWLPEGSELPPMVKASDKDYIKHVRCEGARFHVLSYSTLGIHCSESDCIVNKKIKGNR